MKTEIINGHTNSESQPIAERSAFQTAAVEPWPEPVEGAALLDELARLIRRFVILPPGSADALALWVMHTYAFDLREISTYVGLESPEKRCGKTTLLEVLSLLVNRPILAANISPPALFRVIEEARPTLLIDEADTFLHANEELRGILNAGYSRKAAYVVRVEKSPGQKRSKLASFSCWCPKMMAAIGLLPDTLADRCIVIRMQRKRADEACERVRNLEGEELRRRCARFVRDHAPAIREARPAIPPGLNDRAADIWEPLLALADLAGGAWPEKVRQAAVVLSAGPQEHSPIGGLLVDILDLFTRTGVDRIASRDLVGWLQLTPERPWSEHLRPRELTELWLARQLRPYGIQPRTLRLGEARAKGYALQDMREAFARYIPRQELEALETTADNRR